MRTWSTSVIGLSMLAACSGGATDATDAGPTGPDDAYFGFADRQCLRFQDANGFGDYTIELALDSNTVAGVRTFHATARINGIRQNDWWFEVTQDSLLLHRRRSLEANLDTYTVYTPPPVWMRKNIELGDTVSTDTSARKSSSGGTKESPTTFHVTALMTESVTVAGTPVEATRYTIGYSENGGADVIDKLWLVPGQGIVKIDPSGSDIDAQTLVSSKPLGNGENCE